jgi:uncharacterized membrane protein
MRRFSGQLTLFILSLLGIAISLYLTSVHYENVPLVCTNSGIVDCARVLASRYSVVPGTSIPVTVPGLFWFVVSGVLAFLAWRRWPERRELRIAELVWTILGMLTVFYLVYVEIVRLHTLCAWCTGIHAIILLMLILVIVQLQKGDTDLGDEVEELEEQEIDHAKF